MSYVSGEIKNSINILSGKPFQDTVKKKSPNGFGFQNYILNEKKKVPKRIRPLVYVYGIYNNIWRIWDFIFYILLYYVIILYLLCVILNIKIVTRLIK